MEMDEVRLIGNETWSASRTLISKTTRARICVFELNTRHRVPHGLSKFEMDVSSNLELKLLGFGNCGAVMLMKNLRCKVFPVKSF
jgi:hypothetical protein